MRDQELSPEQVAQLTEADWRARLTDEEYHVLREKGTERAFTGKYTDNEDEGIYRCKGCGAKLFTSDNKYHSGCGWPSFDKTIADNSVDEQADHSLGMQRIEVTCSNCGAHLGHVFPDGPKETTGRRYCINSVALDLDKANS